MSSQPEALRLATVLKNLGWRSVDRELKHAADELCRLHEGNVLLHERHSFDTKEYSKLQAENEALSKDAKRYQWLRNALYMGTVDVGEAYILMRVVGNCPTEAEFDKSIDAAIAKAEGVV